MNWNYSNSNNSYIKRINDTVNTGNKESINKGIMIIKPPHERSVFSTFIQCESRRKWFQTFSVKLTKNLLNAHKIPYQRYLENLESDTVSYNRNITIILIRNVVWNPNPGGVKLTENKYFVNIYPVTIL